MNEKDQNRTPEEEELNRKLDELDKKITPDYLRKRLKLALYKKVEAGDMSALDDIARLAALESTPDAAAPASSQQPGSPHSVGEPGTPSKDEDEIGIPQKLRVKRHYTWSPAAQAARKKNAQLNRPGSVGNKRNWKGGRFAKDFIEGRIKPCLSTCPDYADCELITEGYTKPGGVCLDKAAVIATYSAIMDAIKHKEYDDFNEVSGLMIAETMHVARMLLEDIMRDGGVVKRLKYDKNGVLQSEEFVPHPGLLAVPKFIADLGLNPREMNITPKAIKDDKNTEETNKTVAGLMSDMARRMREQAGQKNEEPEE